MGDSKKESGLEKQVKISSGAIDGVFMIQHKSPSMKSSFHYILSSHFLTISTIGMIL